MIKFAQLITDENLYWWQHLAHFVIALFVGIIVANYLFRDVSWHHLITSESRVSWTTKGQMWHNGFERYLATIFFTTLFVWGVLNYCAIYCVGGFQ